jgi:hypothetical protein
LCPFPLIRSIFNIIIMTASTFSFAQRQQPMESFTRPSGFELATFFGGIDWPAIRVAFWQLPETHFVAGLADGTAICVASSFGALYRQARTHCTTFQKGRMDSVFWKS